MYWVLWSSISYPWLAANLQNEFSRIQLSPKDWKYNVFSCKGLWVFYLAEKQNNWILKVTWDLWFSSKSSIREDPVQRSKSNYLNLAVKVASFSFWTDFVTIFWSRLMERVRVEYGKTNEIRANSVFTHIVYGTLMLALVGKSKDSWEHLFCTDPGSWIETSFIANGWGHARRSLGNPFWDNSTPGE